MASQFYFSLSWVSTEGGDMAPGETHYWSAWFFSWGDVINLTAHAVIGEFSNARRIMTVQNIRTDVRPDGGGRILLFEVKNVGTNSIPGYIVGGSVVNQ